MVSNYEGACWTVFRLVRVRIGRFGLALVYCNCISVYVMHKAWILTNGGFLVFPR